LVFYGTAEAVPLREQVSSIPSEFHPINSGETGTKIIGSMAPLS
jgi:hypothetical protein